MRLTHALVIGMMMTASAGASGQQRPPHPLMPETKPPPMHFPMTADNFRKLAHWYSELATKNRSRMS